MQTRDGLQLKYAIGSYYGKPFAVAACGEVAVITHTGQAVAVGRGALAVAFGVHAQAWAAGTESEHINNGVITH